ncbi:MAG: NAD(P)H-dependent oxidoreductase subunit E, partial [Deltaproteobacteria bacterium]|nr:NAD(P)H-dependent oxidoreductase subunit E [Deltaproteobacteria bacterium]
IENLACLGCCSLAPVVMINDKVYANLDEKKVKKVLKAY